MTSTLEEFNAKFRVEELEVLKSEYWTWSVRPVHSTLGAGILSLNRFCRAFGDVDPKEGEDLAKIIKILEATLRKFSSPDKMNYIMLMMVDVHLHFHVIPRYAKVHEYAGLDWIDSGWPKPPTLNDYEDRASSSALITIRDDLRSHL